MRGFFVGTALAGAPIIPVVAQQGVNIDAVVEALDAALPCHGSLQEADLAPLRMSVVRSFKVSRAGCPPSSLCGGVLGGSITAGVARCGDLLEIRPGLIDSSGTVVRPLFASVSSLQSETSPLQLAGPGGLIGLGTGLDPALCMTDRLVGHVAGTPGTLP